MSDTAVTPAAAPPTTTTQTPASGPQTPATPAAVDPSTAGKALRAARSFEDVKAKGRAAAAPPAEPAKPAAAKVDPDVEAVERILREDRRVKEERKANAADRAKIDADKAAVKAETDMAAAVREAKSKGDALGALKALGFSDADIFEGDESVVFKLAESRVKKPELDEKARFEAVVAEKLAEQDAAAKEADAAAAKKAADDAEAAKAAAAAQTDSARDAYGANVLKLAAASPDKYPTLIAMEVPAKVVIDYAWHTIINSKGATVLTEAQALADVEEHYAQKARKATGGDKPVDPKPEPHRAVTVNPSWQRQEGPPPARPAGTSLKDKEQALRERARKAAAGAGR